MSRYEKERDQKNPYSDLTTYVKKRKGAERRQRPTSLFSGYLFSGRRRALRRGEEDGGGFYVDRFSLADWIPPVALVLIALANMVLSLLWTGSTWIAAAQLGMALFAAVFFLLHARFRSARAGIGGLILLYTFMLAYHGYHLSLLGEGPASAVVALTP